MKMQTWMPWWCEAAGNVERCIGQHPSVGANALSNASQAAAGRGGDEIATATMQCLQGSVASPFLFPFVVAMSPEGRVAILCTFHQL